MINKLEELKLLIEQEVKGCRVELTPAPSDETFLFLDIFLGKSFVTVAWTQNTPFLVGKLNSNGPKGSRQALDSKAAISFIKQELFSSN